MAFSDRYGWPGDDAYRALPLAEIRGELKQYREALRLWGDTDLARRGNDQNPLEDIINSALARHTRIEILSEFGNDGPPFWRRMRIATRTWGWIGAAWLQLALAISDQQQLGRCEECGRLYELKPKRRYERRFCSKRCQVKKWRSS